MPTDSLIFDLDGTLWDSTSPCAEGWNRAISRLRLERRTITPQDIASIMGMPGKQIFETLFPEQSEATREALEKICFEEELVSIRDLGAPLYEGVSEGLALLSRRFPLFIVSNCEPDYLQTFFESTGLKRFFKDSECYGNTHMPKGHNIRLLCERNRLQKPVYIGDTGSDQEAARDAAVGFFHAAWGFGRPGRPCESFKGFDALVEHFLK